MDEHGKQQIGTNGVLTKTITPPKEQKQEMAEMALVDRVIMSLQSNSSIGLDCILNCSEIMNLEISIPSHRTVRRRILKLSKHLEVADEINDKSWLWKNFTNSRRLVLTHIQRVYSVDRSLN